MLEWQNLTNEELVLSHQLDALKFKLLMPQKKLRSEPLPARATLHSSSVVGQQLLKYPEIMKAKK